MADSVPVAVCRRRCILTALPAAAVLVVWRGVLSPATLLLLPQGVVLSATRVVWVP